MSSLASWFYIRATRPQPLRALFGLLRRLKPIFTIGKFTVVSRYLDVLEVLRRDEVFTVSQIYGPQADRLDGPFVLSLDRGPQYAREAALQHRVVLEGDLDDIRTMVAQEARRQIQAATGNRIDVVNDYARIVAVRVGARYFGVPVPDEKQMAGWLRAIFWAIFANATGEPDVRVRALAASSALQAYLDAAIQARHAAMAAEAPTVPSPRPDPGDVLGRMIAEQLASTDGWPDAVTIRRNLTGMFAGTVDNTSQFFTLAVAELLRRPEQLARARQAALAGDRTTVCDFVYEAARFHPVASLLARHVSCDVLLAAGTKRARLIRGGTTVVLGNISAMFDPDGFPEPAEFDIDHNSGELHFGYGLHSCLGRLINRIQLAELATALLAHSRVRPVPSRDGTMQFEGVFPNRYVVEFV